MAANTNRYNRRLGRTEQALEATLKDRPDITKAARTALRVHAHALDLAEQAHDPELINTVSGGYLALLRANGLTSDQPEPVDAFEKLLADLGRAGTSPSHPEVP
jgi:hypothetical protein